MSRSLEEIIEQDNKDENYRVLINTMHSEGAMIDQVLGDLKIREELLNDNDE